MNPAKSEFTADLLISVLVNEPEVPLYLGLLTSEIDRQPDLGLPTLSTKEIDDSSYLRQRISLSQIEKGFVHLLHDIQFPRASKRWSNVTHLGVFDSQKDGNLLLLKSIGTVSSFNAGDAAALMSNEFQLFVGINSLVRH